jgi:hypothetical protein
VGGTGRRGLLLVHEKCQDSRPASQESILGPPEYEEKVLTIGPDIVCYVSDGKAKVLMMTAMLIIIIIVIII